MKYVELGITSKVSLFLPSPFLRAFKLIAQEIFHGN